MERLQEQRANRTDEHRRIGVYPPNRILLTKPALAVSRDLGVLRFEVSGHPISHCFGDGGAWIWECPDGHIAERTRRWKRCTMMRTTECPSRHRSVVRRYGRARGAVSAAYRKESQDERHH
jgi:hypothetical protein